ncbi:hypothetical protein O7635_23525 [Asanoa sp. WMMD1127]|uniref:hypothetical protein n=1 Tax=Asanoa sp. WMMD1127 TaxID=3016107 RepID=UPI00241770F6|nr:hypothetical protein [Asanoa sp. WMMD1127]MDG4824830.1 hypothetical protein [Asanoa sp. WMMD1127]
MSTEVFVDRTGRRRRALTWLAVVAAAVLVGALGLLGAGLFGGGPVPLSGWTDRGAETTPAAETAVIGPAPEPAAPPAPRSTTAPTGRPQATGTPATAIPTTGERPGRGNGRGNRPTAKPSHPRPKAG